MLNIGRLNQRVTFMVRTTTTDSMGQEVNTGFTEYKTVWATVAPLRGAEYWEAQKVRADEIYKVTIRYKNWLAPDMRVKLPDGRICDITAVIDKDYRHEFLEIHCTEHVDTHSEDDE